MNRDIKATAAHISMYLGGITISNLLVVFAGEWIFEFAFVLFLLAPLVAEAIVYYLGLTVLSCRQIQRLLFYRGIGMLGTPFIWSLPLPRSPDLVSRGNTNAACAAIAVTQLVVGFGAYYYAYRKSSDRGMPDAH